MRPRSSEEEHRAATPLELLFDLCFVVAVAQAAASLHHAESEAHIGSGLIGYVMVFFAIWWAWMNFTWFASAYDTDDVPYRLTTLVIIAGVLIMAAGVPHAFAEKDFTIPTIGYAVMRLGMVALWLRAAAGHPAGRACALKYAGGIALVQAAWLARLALPEQIGVPAFGVLALAELAVPVWAERGTRTDWHAGHIAERYGLLTLIMLGESVLAATLAIQEGVDTGEASAAELLTIGFSGMVIVFAMWWLYFEHPASDILAAGNRVAFPWGYGHFFVFSSIAAVGAGLAVSVDADLHRAHLGPAAVGLVVAVPVAVYLLSVWLVHIRPHRPGPAVTAGFPAAAALALAAAFTPVPLPVIAAILAGLVAVVLAASYRQARG
ncbi:low temperature requirement protein A [Thermocatellispora tengchongensis]